jgi:tetratricopeptide (TPR) repeat protein
LTARPLGQKIRAHAVHERYVIAAQVLAEAGTRDPVRLTQLGIEAVRERRWQRALVLLAEAYGIFFAVPERREWTNRIETDTREEQDARFEAIVRMFSHYGLALAMSDRSRVEEAAGFCEIAIRKDPDRAEHYALLGRVWQAGRNRLKMVQAIERGLKVAGYDVPLLTLRAEVGWRKKTAVEFLPRQHPVNVALGKLRHKRRMARYKALSSARLTRRDARRRNDGSAEEEELVAPTRASREDSGPS